MYCNVCFKNMCEIEPVAVTFTLTFTCLLLFQSEIELTAVTYFTLLDSLVDSCFSMKLSQLVSYCHFHTNINLFILVSLSM